MTIAEKFAEEHSFADWTDDEYMNEFWTRMAATAVNTAEVPGREKTEPHVHVFADNSWYDPMDHSFGSSTKVYVDDK